MAGLADRGRRNAFDFLRLFAAVAVVIEHSVVHLDARFLWHAPHDALWFNGGVALFFILSGMMVYTSGERCRQDGRPWREFYRNRALRIVPAIYFYFVAVVVILLGIGSLSMTEIVSGQFVGFAASNLLLIPVYSPPILDDFGIGVVNGSLWTIPVEVSFYLIVPLLVVLAGRVGVRWMLAVVFAVAACSVAAYALMGATASDLLAAKLFGVSFLPYLWWFALGMFWSHYWPRVRQSGGLALLAAVLYFVIAKIPVDTATSHLTGAVAAIPLSYVALWLGYRGPRVLGRITGRIGDLSFGTYIWHMIIINILVTFGARSWNVPGTLLVSGVLVATLGIAAVSWWFIERPALSRKHYSAAREVQEEGEPRGAPRPSEQG